MVAVFVAGALLLFQAQAPAAPTDAPAAHAARGVSPVVVVGPQAKHQAANPSDIVCRREPVLGTLFPKEICARRDELAERQRIDQAATRDAQQTGMLEAINPADKR